MAILKNAPMNHKVNIFFFLKILTFVIIYFLCHCYNEEYTISKCLNNRKILDISPHVRTNRSLAKHYAQNILAHGKVNQKIVDKKMNKIIKNDNLSTYTYLKKDVSNNLDSYKKGYNGRYSKKKGLAKLDCYCEKKIFDKCDYINELKEKYQNDKISFNKKLDKTLIICLILLGIVPLIGFIIPILKTENSGIIQRCFNDCGIKQHLKEQSKPDTHENDKYPKISIDKSTWNMITYVESAFTCIAVVIVLCIVLYIFIKVIKYEQLKAGRDKMSLKEYYHFTKSLL